MTSPFKSLHFQIQSTLVISNSKRLSEILRDIRTSTYHICRIEEKITRTTTFNKYMCNWTLEVKDIFFYLLDYRVSAGTRFSFRNKRLFEISEVEIMRVNCIFVKLICHAVVEDTSSKLTGMISELIK